MHSVEIVYVFVITVGCNADWVEIPQMKSTFGPSPKISGSSFYSGSKTPVNIVFSQGQVENVEARNVSMDSRRMTTEQNVPKRTKSNRITATPAKTSILGVFSSTTQFTPLMSSTSLSQTSTTEPTILKKTSQVRRNKPKENIVTKKRVEEIEVEDYVEPEENETNDSYENKSEPEQSSFSSFAGFLPFLKSIQSTLMQKAHKSIKSKIEVLKNLRDNLLYDIDQRLRTLWPGNENKYAREYKGDSHLEFPSNEGALMTIGFLTLAVFLVKLVLQVIQAIKAKKQYYYNGTGTVTAAGGIAGGASGGVSGGVTIGRKKRFVVPDAETTYKILTTATLTFLLCFVASRKKLHVIVEILRNEFEFNEFSIEAEDLSAKLVKYSQYYVYFTYTSFILLSIQSYLQKESDGSIHDAKANGLPARSWYPFDLSVKPVFAFLLVIQHSTILVILNTTIPIAMCFASLLIHLRAQLFHLQACLIKVCEQKNHDVGRVIMKKCLKLHFILIDFTDKVQDAFSSILLLHNYSASIVISVAGYQASMMSVLDAKFMPSFCQVNYVLAECFVYCYYGQHIIDQSSLVGFTAYDNRWYNCPPDIGRDLSLIIMRSQRPLRLVFLGSINSSLETYYNIVKTGYSYLVFLANMGDSDEM
ncbi:uncharacterized protein CBL_07885 [Carabus blaptoides fortunei]